jgi:hypothetical protein
MMCVGVFQFMRGLVAEGVKDHRRGEAMPEVMVQVVGASIRCLLLVSIRCLLLVFMTYHLVSSAVVPVVPVLAEADNMVIVSRGPPAAVCLIDWEVRRHVCPLGVSLTALVPLRAPVGGRSPAWSPAKQHVTDH